MQIVVPSCVSYSDCWNPFVALFHHFWPSNPYELVLVTDHVDRAWQGDKVVVLDVDLYWSKNLEIGLHSISSDFVLLMQEDFFVSAPVETEFVSKMLQKIQSEPDIACIRLMPCPGPNTDIDDDIGEVGLLVPYRISCQAAIWRKEYLIQLLTMTGDPIDFELKGSVISRSLSGRILSVRRDRPTWPLQYIVTAIVRGDWEQGAIDLCKKLRIPIDTSRRPTRPR